MRYNFCIACMHFDCTDHWDVEGINTYSNERKLNDEINIDLETLRQFKIDRKTPFHLECWAGRLEDYILNELNVMKTYKCSGGCNKSSLHS